MAKIVPARKLITIISLIFTIFSCFQASWTISAGDTFQDISDTIIQEHQLPDTVLAIRRVSGHETVPNFQILSSINIFEPKLSFQKIICCNQLANTSSSGAHFHIRI